MNAANFPYSVHDEPTDEWTIEELLHWCLLQSQYKTISKRDEIINAFQELFDVGKQEILELQNQVTRMHQDRDVGQQEEQQGADNGNIVGGVENSDGDCGSDEKEIDKRHSVENKMVQGIQHDENQHPNIENGNSDHDDKNRIGGVKDDTKSSEAKNETTSAPTSKSATKPKTIQVEIIRGPHMGSKYNLKPVYKKPCWVGRSSSKKFRERGISLNKDDEVSTTHGKFHIHPSGSKGKLMFTDTGSTNGSIYNDMEIEDNVPLELVDGMVLILGNSDLLIHLI